MTSATPKFDKLVAQARAAVNVAGGVELLNRNRNFTI